MDDDDVRFHPRARFGVRMSDAMQTLRMLGADPAPAPAILDDVGPLPACMGGWCARRESCRRYHADQVREPAERLCAPGRHDCWEPISHADQAEVAL